MNQEDDKEKKDPFDGEYIGNIWGWKFSLFGLALIVVLGGLMVYRHLSLGIPFGEGGADEKTEQQRARDSLSARDTLYESGSGIKQ